MWDFIDLFEEIEKSYENITNVEVVNMMEQRLGEEYVGKDEDENFFEIKKSFNGLQDRVFHNLLIDLELQTLINPELFYDSLQKVKGLITEDKGVIGYYEMDFAKVYICSLRLEKELLNLENDIKSNIENNI